MEKVESRKTVDTLLLHSPAVYSLLSSLFLLFFWTEHDGFAFDKLLVYQKAVDFADPICAKSDNFTRGYRFLADQLNRASLSIAASIAEGNGRFTKPDRKNFFGIARGSVHECVPLLELALRRKLLVPKEHESL